MSWYYIKPVLFVFLGVLECKADQERIIGGLPVSIEKHPYIASIILKSEQSDSGDFRGAAVIVSHQWALTAAHCVLQFAQSIVDSGFIFLRSGTSTWDVEDTQKYHNDHKIIYTHAHRNFSEDSGYDCDIAILKVKEPFNGRYENPIKVASRHFRNNFKSATVLGWGTTDYSIQVPMETLRGVNIVMFSHRKCVKYYSNLDSIRFTRNMLCGGSTEGGKDACNGDSGGPLVYSNVLVGLVSYGINCGLAEYPGIYTKLTRFQKWLENMEKQLGTTFGIHFTDTVDDSHRRTNITLNPN